MNPFYATRDYFPNNRAWRNWVEDQVDEEIRREQIVEEKTARRQQEGMARRLDQMLVELA